LHGAGGDISDPHFRHIGQAETFGKVQDRSGKAVLSEDLNVALKNADAGGFDRDVGAEIPDRHVGGSNLGS
jgi:hypothetical protein